MEAYKEGEARNPGTKSKALKTQLGKGLKNKSNGGYKLMMLVFFVVHPLPGADAAARSPNGHPSEVGLWTFFRVWGGGRVKRSYSRVVGREWKTTV